MNLREAQQLRGALEPLLERILPGRMIERLGLE